MIKAQSGQKNKISWKSGFFFSLGIIVLIFIIINLAKSGQKSQKINQEIVGLEQEIKNIEKNNLDLKELIEYFNSTAYIEEKARIDLGLKKEGEKVVVISDFAQGETPKSKISNGEEKELSNPQKWWRYLFK